MNTSALPPVVAREALPWQRLLLVALATLLLHAALMQQALVGLRIERPPPEAAVDVQLFVLPQAIALAAPAPAPAVRRPSRAPAAISSPVAAPVPSVALPVPADLTAPDAPSEPAAQAAPEAEPAPVPAAPQVEVAAPLDSIVVNFPRFGRLVSNLHAQRGLLWIQGTSTIEWRATATTYSASMRASDESGLLNFAQDSAGEIRPQVGVAPVRYTEKSARRAELATNFQWDAGKVTFSSTEVEFPLTDGTQDMLSWLAQLALLAEAFPDRFTPGSSIALRVARVRDVQVYEMRVTGPETVTTAAGPFDAVRLERAVAADARIPRIELWLAPSLRWLPVRTRTVLPGGEIIETELREVTLE